LQLFEKTGNWTRPITVATRLWLPVFPNLGWSGCQLPLLTWKSKTAKDQLQLVATDLLPQVDANLIKYSANDDAVIGGAFSSLTVTLCCVMV